MAKDNNKSNSDLIQRLKTLLAESDQRPSNLPEEENQDPLEESIQDLLKNEDDTRQNAPAEEINQEILEEATQDITINESETQQESPPEVIIQEPLEEAARDFTSSVVEIRQEEPPGKINQDIPEVIIQEPQEEVTQDSANSEAEMRQEEPPEEVKQKPVENYEDRNQLKNKLREGVNMPQVGNYVVNYKNIIVKTSDGSVISGQTNIVAFGRLTEYLKQGTDKFITVFSDETEDTSKKVTIINKDHIIWANTWD